MTNIDITCKREMKELAENTQTDSKNIETTTTAVWPLELSNDDSLIMKSTTKPAGYSLEHRNCHMEEKFGDFLPCLEGVSKVSGYSTRITKKHLFVGKAPSGVSAKVDQTHQPFKRPSIASLRSSAVSANCSFSPCNSTSQSELIDNSLNGSITEPPPSISSTTCSTASILKKPCKFAQIEQPTQAPPSFRQFSNLFTIPSSFRELFALSSDYFTHPSNPDVLILEVDTQKLLTPKAAADRNDTSKSYFRVPLHKPSN